MDAAPDVHCIYAQKERAEVQNNVSIEKFCTSESLSTMEWQIRI